MPSGERYATFFENRFRSTADAPLSTFSIDVDTASYALVRRFLSAGQLPPPDAVRLEELLNYFSYDDPAPAGDDPFSVTVEAATCPWRPGHRLVRVGLRGRDVPRTERPAGNLVFLVDVSGSMAADDKLPLVKQGLTMLVEELDENDRVAIVTYAGDAGLRLPSTSGAEKGAILAAIESLTSGGGTHGSAGIELAYAQAAEHFVRGGVNRVILATDGDLNVGITDDRALANLITAKAAGGTFLTVLGVGSGNLQDEKLETIAAHGNGIYAYLDGAREARKVLVEQLTGSTITIAKDVKIQVEFNPAVVASWRQLGYENRLMAARDFRDDTKDAGDIGAGHAVTALYEVALVSEADDQSGGEPLKYAAPGEPRREPAAAASTELLTVKLRFKRPDGDTSMLREVPLAERGGDFTAASADLRFAAAVAGFGMLLRTSEHAGDATYGWVAATASKALGADAGGWRTEFLDLVRRAESLAPRVGPPGVTPSPRPMPLTR
jgi:Ca-activated chloride channel family protein